MLSIAYGQCSVAGRKPENQDHCGARIPAGETLRYKGVAAAMADGISTSTVSGEASQVAVDTFLEDYFCTSDAWSVERAGTRVLEAINGWLFSRTRNSPFFQNPDKGYICTFSAVVFRHQSAYTFHVGDSRIYRLRDQRLEQLTRDHRVWAEAGQHYLANALGMKQALEVDCGSVTLEAGDIFILTTDGLYDFVSESELVGLLDIRRDDLSAAAEELVELAFQQDSDDNLSVQLLRIDAVAAEATALVDTEALPVPPVLSEGQTIDGYRVLRQLYASARSHAYLVNDGASEDVLVLKAPSVEMADSESHLESLLMEEWIARRVSSPYLLDAPGSQAPRTALYAVTRYIEGQTLSQWLADNPDPDLETVRTIVEQVGKGLTALHRADILHQDIRPENILIDAAGKVTLIDYGAARVGGVEGRYRRGDDEIPGTALYAAPEYFLGAGGDESSEVFSLAVLTYYLLSGQYPYGTAIARCNNLAAQRKLRYRSVCSPAKSIPLWVDQTLQRALQINPDRRYPVLSEFLYDLRHPNPRYLSAQRPPLIERDPVRFWQGVSALLLLALIVVLVTGI